MLVFLPMAEQKNSILMTILEAEQGTTAVNSRKELKLETTHKTVKKVFFQKLCFPLNPSTQTLLPKARDVNTFRVEKMDNVA